MSFPRLIFGFFILLLAVGPAHAFSEHMGPQPGRIALVIGVSQYAGPARLAAPTRDAQLVAATLHDLGFEAPVLLINPTDVQMRAAIENLVREARDLTEHGTETTAIVYFAGHGLVVDRESFLLPVNFEVAENESAGAVVHRRAITADWIAQQLASSGARRLLLVIDACRNNNPWQADLPAFPIEPPQSSGPDAQDAAIWLSAARGQSAIDRIGNEETSPFATSFARQMRDQGHRSLNDAFAAISEEVSQRTRNIQRPVPIGLINYRLTTTDAELQAVRRAASQQIPALSAVAPLVAGGASGRFPLREFAPPFTGDPCPIPLTRFNPLSYHRRYVELYGQERLEQRARAGQGCEQYLLAVGYTRRGHEDRDAAVRWLQAAEANGVVSAVTGLTWVYTSRTMGEPDIQAARHWFDIGSARGVPGAIRNLAISYRDGTDGYERNIHRAIELFETAARLGNGEAALNLAALFSTGEAVPRNVETAISWYRRAVALGSDAATPPLANIYFYGMGVPPDRPLAVRLVQEAARDGNVYAIRWLTYLYESEPGYQDPARAFEAYLRLAEAGDAEAMISVADRLKRGNGTAVNIPAALEWYRRADAAGEPDGALRLASHYRDAGGTENLQRSVESATRALSYAQGGEPTDIWPITFVQAGQLIQVVSTMPNAPPIDRAFLIYLARNYGRPGNMKRFTVPISCGGASIPYNVYVFDWDRSESPVAPQLAWVERERGCTVPPDVKTSFERLYEISQTNNVSFADLTVYALTAAREERPAPSSPPAPSK